MRAGSLNEIITVEQPFHQENELGEVVDCHYVKKFTTKAQVVYKSGSTSVENEKVFTSYSVQFIIRFYHQPTETDRVIYRGQKYRIDAIERNREHQMIKLNCTLIDE